MTDVGKKIEEVELDIFKDLVLKKFSKMHTRIKKKISIQHFVWVVAVLLLFLVYSISYSAGQLSYISKTLPIINENVASIKNIIDNLEFKTE